MDPEDFFHKGVFKDDLTMQHALFNYDWSTPYNKNTKAVYKLLFEFSHWNSGFKSDISFEDEETKNGKLKKLNHYYLIMSL